MAATASKPQLPQEQPSIPQIVFADAIPAPEEIIEEIAAIPTPLEIIPEEEEENIYLADIDTITSYAAEFGLTLQIMMLDIDETILLNDTQELKHPKAWATRMAKEREKDITDNRLTVWGIATFRYAFGGIYEQLNDAEPLSYRPEIAQIFERFQDYINPNLIYACGGEAEGDHPACKVEFALDDLYFKTGALKSNIVIFDDNHPFVIERAWNAGYGAVHISSDPFAAINAIRNGDGTRPSQPASKQSPLYSSLFGQVSRINKEGEAAKAAEVAERCKSPIYGL